MQFIQTRGNDGTRPESSSFSNAILNPSASFGGLYVPESLPEMGITFLADHIHSDYKNLAFAILQDFGIDIDEDLLWEALDRYDHFDDANNPVPVVKIDEQCYVSELYHGPTRAFKDMALQPFGVILSRLAQQRDEQYLIMAATSGDTGPATLETFKDKPNIRVACLYPDGGTSDVQRLQMVTEDASNLKVVGIEGNFDDAQQALKTLLSSEEFKAELSEKGIELSAANSVNFGRIIFQIIYHVHGYLELVRQGEIGLGDEIYIVVPSGNFGNALGAYYARKAGLPVRKILIASNANNILTELINTGVYDIRDRELILTESPAMDILKSSNVERVLYDLYGAQKTREWMDALTNEGVYRLDDDELRQLQEIFSAVENSDAEGEAAIAEYAKQGYVMDPHTATCLKAFRSLRETDLPSLVCSTAEWTKFSPTVARAMGLEATGDEEALAQVHAHMDAEIPRKISSLFTRKISHSTVVGKDQIKDEMLTFLG
jgi:threonine synthase